MKFKNMELIKNWNKLENRATVYNLYDSEDIHGHSLSEKMDCCDLVKITGEPKRCSIAKYGTHKGMQVYLDTGKGHHQFTILELTMKVLESDFINFTKQFTAFYYNSYENEQNQTSDLTFKLAEVCSANYGLVNQYGSIKDRQLKALIKEDKDTQKVLLTLYTSALSIKWYTDPTDEHLPCTRLSAPDISRQTGISERKVGNILKILRLLHAIAEVPVSHFSKPYFERYIDANKVWQHKPVYVIFPLAEVNWSLISACGITTKTVITQSAVFYWFGDDVAQEVFPDKVNHSISLPLMIAFGDIIRASKYALSVRTIKDTALAIVQESTDEVIPKETVNTAWKSFQTFLPWAGVKVVTSAQAKKAEYAAFSDYPQEKVVILI